MMTCRIIPFVSLLLLSVLTTGAQTVVKDRNDGTPLAFASVFNEKGQPIGMTDDEGRLPDLKGSRCIHISSLGYQSLKADVSSLSGCLEATPVAYPLGEVVTEMPKAARLKLTCYYRNYITVDSTIYIDRPDNGTRIGYDDGICILYVPKPGSIDITSRKNVAQRDVIGAGFFGTNYFSSNLYINSRSRLDLAKNNDKYLIREKGNTQTIYKQGKDTLKWEATLRYDSVAQTIHEDYIDGINTSVKLNPQRVMDGQGNRLNWYGTAQKPHVHKIYRMIPNARMSCATLAAYSILREYHYHHQSAKRVIVEHQEIYPVKEEYLTKEEYKAEKKKQEEYSIDDINRMAKEAQVPDLSPEIQELINEYMRAQSKARL